MARGAWALSYRWLPDDRPRSRLAAGPHPAAPALVTGAATWLILTARHDLAPPRN